MIEQYRSQLVLHHYNQKALSIAKFQVLISPSYSPLKEYQPKITRPIATGVNTAIIIIQGMGLPISPFAVLIFAAALYTNNVIALTPVMIHKIPSIRLIWFIK